MENVTKGEFVIVNAGSFNGVSIRVKDKGFVAVFHNGNMSVHGDTNALGNATICAEALNVHSETGLSLKEMQERISKLEEAIKLADANFGEDSTTPLSEKIVARQIIRSWTTLSPPVTEEKK